MKLIQTVLTIGIFLSFLTNCTMSESEVNPQTNTSDNSPSTTVVVEGTLPDTTFVFISANKSFVFATDVNNSVGKGESSPIENDYYLNKYMVTNEQWKAYLTANNKTSFPSYWLNGSYPEGKAKHPVLYVSYTECESYCIWLATRVSGYTFRLPTEAEFENAAAGPNKYTYPWGNSQDASFSNGILTSKYNYNAVVSAYYLKNYGNDLATFNEPSSTKYNARVALNTILSVSSNGGVSGWIDHTNYLGFVYTDIFDSIMKIGGYTTPVGAYPQGKSLYGCYDMAGNAFEWTSSKIIAQNGAEKGVESNAVRGGSWYSNGSSCKTTYRGEGRKPSGGYATVGFRVVAVKK